MRWARSIAARTVDATFFRRTSNEEASGQERRDDRSRRHLTDRFHHGTSERPVLRCLHGNSRFSATRRRVRHHTMKTTLALLPGNRLRSLRRMHPGHGLRIGSSGDSVLTGAPRNRLRGIGRKHRGEHQSRDQAQDRFHGPFHVSMDRGRASPFFATALICETYRGLPAENSRANAFGDGALSGGTSFLSFGTKFGFLPSLSAALASHFAAAAARFRPKPPTRET